MVKETLIFSPIGRPIFGDLCPPKPLIFGWALGPKQGLGQLRVPVGGQNEVDM